jgi:hypothetical protein
MFTSQEGPMHRTALHALVVLACAALTLAPAPGRADDGSTGGRNPFGVMVTALPYSGFGGGVTIGPRAFGVRLAAGYVPILLVIQDEGDSSSSDFKLYSSFQLSPDVYVRLFGPEKMSFGVQAGYRYNSILGSGFAGGGYGQFRFGQHLDGLVNLGLVAYPDGEKRLEDKEDLPDDTKFGFPSPAAQFVVGFGLVYQF